MNDACEAAVGLENTKYYQIEFELPYGSMFAKSLLKHKDLEHLGKSLFFNKDLAKKSAKSLFFNKDLARHGKSLFFNKDLAKVIRQSLIFSRWYTTIFQYILLSGAFVWPRFDPTVSAWTLR